MLSIPPFYKPSIKKRKNGNNRKRTKGRSFVHVPVFKEITKEEAIKIQGKRILFRTVYVKGKAISKVYVDTGRTKVIINKPENKRIIKFPNV